MYGDGGHAMVLIGNGFAVSCTRRGLLGLLFSAPLALALFHPGAATAQEAKQIKFTEPPEQIKKEIAALKADKSVPEAEKKEDLAELEASLKTAKPIQFKENIALVLKYFDKLAPLMQDSNQRPAD